MVTVLSFDIDQNRELSPTLPLGNQSYRPDVQREKERLYARTSKAINRRVFGVRATTSTTTAAWKDARRLRRKPPHDKSPPTQTGCTVGIVHGWIFPSVQVGGVNFLSVTTVLTAGMRVKHEDRNSGWSLQSARSRRPQDT